MNPRPLRIGIVGAGANTRLRHIPGFRAIEGVALTVVANRSVESAQRAASEFGINRAASHWREVVAAPDVDAVMIGTWPYLHAEISIAALAAGKHVLTEARMAMDVAEAEAMLAAAEARPDLVAQIVPAPMSLDLDATVAETLASGAIGALREACISHTGGQYADSSAPFSWRQDRDLSGFNTLTFGIYYEMLRRWLGADPAWMSADAAVFTTQRHEASSGTMRPVQIPESLTCCGRYADGTRLIGHFSGVESGPARNEIRLNGSRGSLRADLAKGELFLSRAGSAEEQRLEIPADHRRGWRVEADFVASIREGQPVRLTDFATGVRYMRATEAALRSAGGQGCRVSVDTLQFA
jgi:predicted dehydrogenase